MPDQYSRATAVLSKGRDNSNASRVSRSARGAVVLNTFSLRRSLGFLLGTLALLMLLGLPIPGLAPALTPAHAADGVPPTLFKASPSSIVKSLSSAKDVQVVRSRAVELDRSLLMEEVELPAGARVQKKGLSLNLFDDVSFIAEVDRIEATPHGMLWIGTLRGVEQSQVVIVVRGEIVAGNISLPDGRYHIRYIGNALHEIQKIDPSLFPEEAPPVSVPIPVPIPATTPAPDFSEPKNAFAATSTNLPTDSQADDGSIIDVMVVYSATTRSAAGGSAAMQTLIDLAVAETNQSYQNSGVSQRLRLVHSEEVVYNETGNILDALRCITSTSDGCLDHIHALRTTYGADLVSFWVEKGDYCGISNMMRTVSSSFESQAFSAVERSCASGYYSFGHELGHNMGASHDVYVETSNYPYSYAHGYTFASAASPWRTMMAYNDACQAVGKYCARLQYWSNPAIFYGADAMGDAKADNHLTLNNTAKVVANFRSSVATPACSIVLSASSTWVNATATTGALSVSTASGCLWSAASNSGWISVTTGAAGNGSASVSYAVQANTSNTSRVGTLNIAGQTFTVTQAAAISTCTPTALTANRMLSATLSSSDCVDIAANGSYYYDLFAFSGTPGQKLTLSATSSQFTPDLLLLTPDGTTLYGDDSGDGTTPAIVTTLNQTGAYQVFLSSAFPRETGSYAFTFSLSVATGSDTLPDLVVSSVSAGTQATAGASLYMNSVIKNQGLGAAPATDAGIYLSSDRSISTADVDTGFGCPIPALAAGESYSGCSGNITLRSAITAGTYYLGVYADLNGGIAESNEANNGLAATTTTQISASVASLSVVEFYHAALDHYFITADASEAAAIDNGSAGPGWIRTGESFKAGGSTPVCRFYGSVSPGPNSHFYTLAGAECESLKQLQARTPSTQKRWNFESLDFSSTPPTSGVCANGVTSVYRAYNNGYTQGIDSNHRITRSLTALQQVVARGWVNEGVVMCAPP
jgi:hypothetical protein